MRRLLLLPLLVLAALAYTPSAQAAATCTVTHQFDSTYAQLDVPPIDWLVGNNGTLTAHCSTKWYVQFTAQCKTGVLTYSQCITNLQCANAPACTGNSQGWGAGTTHTYGPSGTPVGFSDLWDSADGFTKSGSICDYIWRVKEVFKNGIDGTTIGSASFAPEGWCM
jgi:hypothetical protein